MANETKASTKITRWFAPWPDGRMKAAVPPDWKKRGALIEGEDRILHCLGAAVIMRWNDLPTEIQREIFASAASLGNPLDAPELKEQIARFLHSHYDL